MATAAVTDFKDVIGRNALLQTRLTSNFSVKKFEAEPIFTWEIILLKQDSGYNYFKYNKQIFVVKVNQETTTTTPPTTPPTTTPPTTPPTTTTTSTNYDVFIQEDGSTNIKKLLGHIGSDFSQTPINSRIQLENPVFPTELNSDNPSVNAMSGEIIGDKVNATYIINLHYDSGDKVYYSIAYPKTTTPLASPAPGTPIEFDIEYFIYYLKFNDFVKTDKDAVEPTPEIIDALKAKSEDEPSIVIERVSSIEPRPVFRPEEEEEEEAPGTGTGVPPGTGVPSPRPTYTGRAADIAANAARGISNMFRRQQTGGSGTLKERVRARNNHTTKFRTPLVQNKY